MDAAWVCGAFETSRRREVLNFNYHKEVAALALGIATRRCTAARVHCNERHCFGGRGIALRQCRGDGDHYDPDNRAAGGA
jgi:hypothetical protein